MCYMKIFNWFYVEYKPQLIKNNVDISVIELIYTEYVLNDEKNTVFKSTHPPCSDIKIRTTGAIATPFLHNDNQNKLTQQENFIVLNLQSISKQLEQTAIHVSNRFDKIEKIIEKMPFISSISFIYPQKLIPDSNKFHILVQNPHIIPPIIHPSPPIPPKAFKNDIEKITLRINTIHEESQPKNDSKQQEEVESGYTSLDNLINMFKKDEEIQEGYYSEP
ncbi:hypothetical protein ACH5RR_036388 [Cinchona calisaya]|uniref:Uncharacterized protein n=1 Tax=Cinchona calisaya TaxID=153742 RepID=A0ABD2Y6L9_9GENT